MWCLSHAIRILAVNFFLFAMLPVSLKSQQSSSPAPVVEPTPAVEQMQAIAVPDIGRRSTELATMLRATAAHTREDGRIQEIRDELSGLSEGVADLSRFTREALKGSTGRRSMGDLPNAWQALSSRVSDWAGRLERRARNLELDRTKLEQVEKEWELTLNSDELRELPAAVRNRIATRLDDIRMSRSAVNTRRSEIVLLQADVAEQRTLIETIIEEIRTAESQKRFGLMTLDSVPLWQESSTPVAAASPRLGLPLRAWNVSEEWVRTYVEIVLRRLVFVILLVVVLMVVFRVRRPRASVWSCDPNENVRALSMVVQRPYSAGILLGLLLSMLVVHDLPSWTFRFGGWLLLVPLLRVLPGLVEGKVRGAFYPLAALLVSHEILSLFSDSSFANRIAWIAVQTATVAFLWWLLLILRSRSMKGPFPSVVRAITAIALFWAVIAMVANVSGMVQLSKLLTHVNLVGFYMLVLIRGTVIIVSGLLVLFVRWRPIDVIDTSPERSEYLARKVTHGANVFGAIAFILAVLYLTTLLDPTVLVIKSFLSRELQFGAVSITLYSVFMFFVVIASAILISKALRLILEVAVYPRVELNVGQAGAFSKILHYLVLLGGFGIAVASAGLGLSNMALLAGGLSVGVGFGLQNLVNNFVSGLVLLFERPIEVGDSVTVRGTAGKVRDIGIRASVIRAWDGADVIVPNGDLIAAEVTNWTHSDTCRRVDVAVGTAYGVDPEEAMGILTRIANEHPLVLKHPEQPIALFTGFGDSSLKFVLRFWCDTSNWIPTSSEIYTSINDAFRSASIEIPFPQRDLHIREIPQSLRRDDGREIVTES